MPTEGITTHYFDCACNSSDHTLRFSLHEEYKGDEPSLYSEVQLRQYHPWYQRVWMAIKYVFGYQCRYGHWDCFLFEKETAVQMRDLLNRYLKMHEEFESRPKD